MIVLAGLHVVSPHFSDDFQCLGSRVIHRNSVNLPLRFNGLESNVVCSFSLDLFFFPYEFISYGLV